MLPVPVEPSGPPAAVRDIAAVTYAANPSKKGLDRVLAAWRALRGERAEDGGEELRRRGRLGRAAARRRTAFAAGAGSPGAGRLVPDEFRALLRRARVFVCAPRREDYGIVQLEALADGCQLVTTAAPGPYAALPLARELDPRLVGDDLASALRAALDEPLPDYAERAQRALVPFSREAIDRIVAEQLLPRLLA